MNPSGERGTLEIRGFVQQSPNKSQTTPQASPKHGIDILQSQKLKQYSVADELVKWAKLKEDGHISDDEFDEARSKLLGRS